MVDRYSFKKDAEDGGWVHYLDYAELERSIDEIVDWVTTHVIEAAIQVEWHDNRWQYLGLYGWIDAPEWLIERKDANAGAAAEDHELKGSEE